jgi:hypothetical protein
MENLSTGFKEYCNTWLEKQKEIFKVPTVFANATSHFEKSQIIDDEVTASTKYLEKEAEGRIGHRNPDQHILADEMAGIIVRCLQDYRKWLNDNI